MDAKLIYEEARYVVVSGDTFKNKEELKKAGLTWSPDRKARYKKNPDSETIDAVNKLATIAVEEEAMTKEVNQAGLISTAEKEIKELQDTIKKQMEAIEKYTKRLGERKEERLAFQYEIDDLKEKIGDPHGDIDARELKEKLEYAFKYAATPETSLESIIGIVDKRAEANDINF